MVEFTPSVEGAVEFNRRLGGNLLHILVGILHPSRLASVQRCKDLVEYATQRGARLVDQTGRLDDLKDIVLEGIFRFLKIQDLGNVRRESQPGRSKPDRLKMRRDEALVGDVERGRADGTGHHVDAPLEEVLVMG